jgi:hypothetical protein
LGERDVIVLEENDAISDSGMLRELNPFLDHPLAFVIGRMHLAGNDDLCSSRSKRSSRLRLRSSKSGRLYPVNRRAKPQREDIPVERRVRQCHRSLWMAAPPEVPLQSGADSEHKLVPGFAPHRPERFIRERRHVPV